MMNEVSEQTMREQPCGDPPSLTTFCWQYRKWIGIGMLAGCLIGGILAFTRPSIYTATGTLLFPAAPTSKLNALAGGGSGDLPSMPLLEGALQVPQPGTSAGTAMLILQSRQARTNVLQALRGQAPSIKLEAHWQADQQEALSQLAKNALLKIGKQGELYVSFSDRDPKVAQAVSLAMIDELKTLSRSLGLDPAETNIAFLESQVTESQQQMLKTQSNLLQFQRKYRIIALPEQAKALAERYTRLQNDTVATQLEASVAMRQANLQANAAGRMIQACVDPNPAQGNTLSPLYQQVMQTESELALLREEFTANHPQVQEKGNQLAVQQQLLKVEIDRQLRLLKSGSSPVVSSIVVQAAVAKARADGLQSVLATTQQQVEALPIQQARFAALAAEVEAAQTSLKLFRQELEKARLIAETRGPIFITIDQPEVPAKRDPAHRAEFLLLGMIVGTLFGALRPYQAWMREKTVRENRESAGSIPVA